MIPELKEFIEANIDLIDDNDFTELYNRCRDDNRGKLTDVLYECGINPLQYMTEIPDMFAAETELTSITIPNSVTSIGKHAFDECSKLNSVTIGNSVEWIGKYAFAGCETLTNITIPESVTTIGNYAFSVCDSLTSVKISDSVTKIDKGVFLNCTSLTSVTIGNSVKIIGESAFNECSELTSVTIPNSVTSIGEGAFQDCGHIKISYYGTKQEWENLITEKNIFPYTTYVCNCSDGVVEKRR